MTNEQMIAAIYEELATMVSQSRNSPVGGSVGVSPQALAYRLRNAASLRRKCPCNGEGLIAISEENGRAMRCGCGLPPRHSSSAGCLACAFMGLPDDKHVDSGLLTEYFDPKFYPQPNVTQLSTDNVTDHLLGPGTRLMPGEPTAIEAVAAIMAHFPLTSDFIEKNWRDWVNQRRIAVTKNFSAKSSES